MQGVRTSQGKAFLPLNGFDGAWFAAVKASLGETFAVQRAEAFLWAPVVLACGILIYFALPFEPGLALTGGLAGFAVLVFSFSAPRSVARLIATGLVILALGFGAAKIRTDMVYTPILDSKINMTMVKGYISKVERLEGKNTFRVVVNAPEIEKLGQQDTPRYVRIKLRNETAPQVGQYVEVLAGLNPPSTPALPGGFDFRRYMYFQGVGAVGFSYGAPKVLTGGGTSSAGQFIEQLRNRIAERIISVDDRYGAVAAALLVGQRRAIHEDDNEALRNAGLAHMLAISGLHIGLFFGVVFFCVRLLLAGVPSLALRRPIKNYAAVAAITAAGFYMLIAGATIPTQRAMMMMALVFVAILMNRTPLSMRLVAFAACVVLLIAPESLIYPSFQMSFAAVAGLVAFFQMIKPYWSGWYSGAGIVRRGGLYVLGVMMTTMVASLSTAPFALYHFHQFAVLGIVANLLAMPVLAFLVMPFAVLFFVLMPFGLEGLVLPIMMVGIGFILDAAHFVSSSDLATMKFKAWSGAHLAVYALGFVVTLLAAGRLRYVGVLIVVCFALLVSGVKKPDLIVSDDASLIAIRTDEGAYVFSSLRKNKFVRTQWSEALALKPEQVQGWKEGQEGTLRCDEYACRAEVKGQKLSVVYTPEIIEQECGWADVLISDRPLLYCKDAQVIDRFDVYRKGAAAVFISDDGAKIQHVINPDIQRPWWPEQ